MTAKKQFQVNWCCNLNQLPCAIYEGEVLKKNRLPRKYRTLRKVWQTNLIKD